MAMLPTTTIFTSLQNSFQSLIEAIQKGESVSSLEEKQKGIALLVDTARGLQELDEARALSLKKIQQLDIHNKLATLSGLIDLQKQLNEMIVEDLQKKLVGVQLWIDHVDEKLKKIKDNADLAIDFLQRENRIMKERLEGYFGKGHWDKYFGDVGIEPPLPRDIQQKLEKQCPFWTDKKVKETHILILIPASLNGQPLTLSRLQSIVQNPQFGNNKTTFHTYHNLIREQHGTSCVPQSEWALVTNDVVPNSRNHTYADQDYEVRRYNYHTPYTFILAMAIFMEHAVYGKILYNGVFSRTLEEITTTSKTTERTLTGRFRGGGGLDFEANADSVCRNEIGMAAWKTGL